MASIHVERKHGLTHAKARSAAEGLAGDLHKRFGLEYTWHGDDVDFQRPGVKGRMHVGEDTLSLDVSLGFLLTPLKASIEHQIHSKLDEVAPLRKT